MDNGATTRRLPSSWKVSLMAPMLLLPTWCLEAQDKNEQELSELLAVVDMPEQASKWVPKMLAWLHVQHRVETCQVSWRYVEEGEDDNIEEKEVAPAFHLGAEEEEVTKNLQEVATTSSEMFGPGEPRIRFTLRSPLAACEIYPSTRIQLQPSRGAEPEQFHQAVVAFRDDLWKLTSLEPQLGWTLTVGASATRVDRYVKIVRALGITEIELSTRSESEEEWTKHGPWRQKTVRLGAATEREFEELDRQKKIWSIQGKSDRAEAHYGQTLQGTPPITVTSAHWEEIAKALDAWRRKG